jgi:glucose-1-phosphate cytidylyltransferase
VGNDGLVDNIKPVGNSNLWINGGFFIFKKEIFNYIKSEEELVVEPFQRLIAQNQLIGYKNPGFWACMDTLKEKMMFDEMYAKGNTPWAVWESITQVNPNSDLSSLPTQLSQLNLQKV